MNTVRILLLLIVSTLAHIPKISVSTKKDQEKRGFFEKTEIQLHFILRCTTEDMKETTFNYHVKLHEGRPNEFLGYSWGQAVNDAYGIVYGKGDGDNLSGTYDFTITIRHDCRGATEENEFGGRFRCGTISAECEFLLDVDLNSGVEKKIACNEKGACSVNVENW